MLMMLVLRLTKFRQSLGRAAALAVGSKTARSESERERAWKEIQLMLMMLVLRLAKFRQSLGRAAALAERA